jgi:hypothetical protein
MKKILSLAVILLFITSVAGAQSRFGIKAGLNFNTLQDVTESGSVENAWKAQTGYHFGVAWQIKVPLLGLAIQPELMYSKVKTSFVDAYMASPNQNPNLITPGAALLPTEIEIDYLTLPINLQLGIDMLVFRPFIVVSPYITLALQDGVDLEDQDYNINRFNYGVGAGIGVDIWKLQIMAKYNWGLGKLVTAGETTWEQKYGDAKLQGFQVSAAFLF